MATDTAPTRLRHLWQLPLFALGVGCAVAAWAMFPPKPESPAEQYQHDLGQLKKLLDRRPVDLHALQSLLTTVESGLNQFPESAPSAGYFLGSAYVILAEAKPEDPEYWRRALLAFKQVVPNSLTDPIDQQRFLHRRGKTLVATGQRDPTLLPLLQTLPPGEEQDGELQRLLAEIYLVQDPPEFKKAAEALSSYLGGAAKIPVAVQASAKLKLGEIHLRLNEVEKARARLTDIGPSAPPEVAAKAQMILAKLFSSENHWSEAVKLYERLTQQSTLSDEELAEARYQLGIGYLNLKQVASAMTELEQVSRSPGPVGAAAALKLAELTLRDPMSKGQRSAAVQRLEAAMRDVGPGKMFENPLVTINQVQATFEEAIQTALNEGDFATAIRAASAYEPIAPPGRDREKRAAAQAAWAEQLARDPAKKAEAQVKFRSAAEDYRKLAETYPSDSGQADLFRKAIECYRQAGDELNTQQLAEQLARSTKAPPEAIAFASIELAELSLTKRNYLAAVNHYQKAIQSATPLASQARVKLALLYLDLGKSGQRTATTEAAKKEAAGQLDYANKVLTEVANTPASGPVEQSAQQLALFELGNFQLYLRNYADAESRFRQFLQSYPTAPLAGQVKLYLGSCLLLLARGDLQGGQPPVDADRKLAEAHQLFASLADSTDSFLRTHADIRLANTTLLMKRYDEMPALCEKLIQRYSGKVEELIILSMLYTAYRKMNREEPAARTLDHMKRVFQQLSDQDFPGGGEEYTRQYWEKDWFSVLKTKP